LVNLLIIKSSERYKLDKRPIKILGHKKSDFDSLAEKNNIQLRDARLIPSFKLGDEVGLASVLLSSMRMIREFRRMILSDLKMSKGGQFFAYNEVVFPPYKNCRFDGLALIVKGGIIRDAAIFEMKNGSNEIDKQQIEKYMDIARNCSIPRIVTVSNQFVSEPTQSPVDVRSLKSVGLYHFSWSYVLTLAHILLFDNDMNIEDPDQVDLMKEVVRYFEYDKSGICGFTQMKKGWKEIVEKINSGARLKLNDPDLDETVVSWQQEEKDLALILSKNLGVFVTSGVYKYKGDLSSRLKDDKKRLIEDKLLSSSLKVKNAVSDIEINAFFEKRIVEMSVSIIAPQDKKIRGQLSWIRRQLDKCKKKNKKIFGKIKDEVLIEISLKNTSKSERVSIENLDMLYEEIKDREIKEFKIILIKDFGKKFSSCRKFVEIIEEMLIDYYSGIVQYLTKWEETAPKIIKEDGKETVKKDSDK
jgi:hypothetical protein